MAQSSNTDATGDILNLGRGNGKPWVRTPEWIVVCGLSAPAQALYTAILGHVNHKRGGDAAWPGMDRLAAMLGFKHRHSIARYVRELAAAGAIDVQRKPGTTHRLNLYTIHRDPPADYTGPRRIADFKTPKVAPKPAPKTPQLEPSSTPEPKPKQAPLPAEEAPTRPAPRDTERSLGRDRERSQNQTNTTRRISTTASGAAPKLPAARRAKDLASGAASTRSTARADRRSKERQDELADVDFPLDYDSELLGFNVYAYAADTHGEAVGLSGYVDDLIARELEFAPADRRHPRFVLNAALKYAREGVLA